MGTVTEHLTLFGVDEPLRVLERDEHLLLTAPHPSPMPFLRWPERAPLEVVHHPVEFSPQTFAPPRGVFENDKLRVEWQTMDNRQPFYHRNCDVDEISYQIDGERTLMTELGVVEHRRGEFSRLPRGVAHDNWGRKESHLLFYTPAPAAEECAPIRESAPTMPPFPGWAPGQANEAITQCLASPGHDIAVFPVDEQRLLDHAGAVEDRLQVLCGTGAPGTTWLYRNDHVRIGMTVTPPSTGQPYTRTLDADEVQYQASGTRTVVTQRGIVELRPGDFLRIPLGVAHTAVARERSEHIRVLCNREIPRLGEVDRTSQPYTPELLAAARGDGPSA